jgi:cytochrome c peroxidase
MWDGGINHIEVQPLGPISNPVEMDSDLNAVILNYHQVINTGNCFLELLVLTQLIRSEYYLQLPSFKECYIHTTVSMIITKEEKLVEK